MLVRDTLVYSEDQSPVSHIEIYYEGDRDPDHQHTIRGLRITQTSGLKLTVGDVPEGEDDLTQDDEGPLTPDQQGKMYDWSFKRGE